MAISINKNKIVIKNILYINFKSTMLKNYGILLKLEMSRN